MSEQKDDFDKWIPAEVPAVRFVHGGVNRPGAIHLVADDPVAADLDPQRIEEHDWIHRLQRPVLPGRRLGHDLVGDRADEVRRGLRAVGLVEELLDLANAHAAGVHG